MIEWRWRYDNLYSLIHHFVRSYDETSESDHSEIWRFINMYIDVYIDCLMKSAISSTATIRHYCRGDYLFDFKELISWSRYYGLLVRPRRSRSAAAYSDQTFPLTICRSVCLSVCPVHCEKNGGSDPDAVWRHRSDGSRDEAGSVVWGSVHWERVLLGANLGRAIVTNGDFTAYVCDSTATRPSSQITLGRLVM